MAVELETPSQAFQIASPARTLAIFAEDAGGGGITGPRLGVVVGGMPPQTSGHGASTAGVQHRQCGIVCNELG